MNRRFLGDALDWWKGGLLGCLLGDRYLRDLMVVPCVTDAADWSREDLLLYSELVGVDPEDISEEADTDEHPDLFFDPDTGIRTGRVDDAAKYLAPNRLLRALSANENRVAAVFQFVRGKSVRSRLDKVVSVLRSADERPCFCSSESGTVAMLFASHHCGRIESIHSGLSEKFRDKATDRVGLWKCDAKDLAQPA